MGNVNRVSLSGNLTRDPELQVTQGGTAVLKFGLAVGEKRGEKDHTNFFDCVVFGEYGEAMQRYLAKGQKVTVAGSLHYSSWTDPKSGYKRSKVEVNVRVIDTMGPAPARDPHDYASGQQMPLAAAPPQVPAPEVYDEDIPFDWAHAMKTKTCFKRGRSND